MTSPSSFMQMLNNVGSQVEPYRQITKVLSSSLGSVLLEGIALLYVDPIQSPGGLPKVIVVAAIKSYCETKEDQEGCTAPVQLSPKAPKVVKS